MFDVIKFKELIKELKNICRDTQGEWDYGINLVNTKLVNLIDEDINGAIDYIKTDCTGDEFIWLSEFFEEVIEKTLSQDYIDTLRIIAKKYPEEDKKYKISAEIDYVQSRLDYLLNPED